MEAGFPLRKWTTNSTELRNRLPDHSRIEAFSMKETGAALVLGMSWATGSDNFNYETNTLLDEEEKEKGINSKRLLLTVYSRLFDPLGLVYPFVITARILYQEVCRRKLPWDQDLPTDILEKWKRWKAELPLISACSTPRYYFGNLGKQRNCKLHVFCDASELAYGAVAYLRTEDETGAVHVSLVASKAKVSPIKLQTIPKLELDAAKMGVKLADYILNSFGSDYNLKPIFWSDSMIALGWIRGEPYRWKTYVANRVQFIQLSTDPSQWRHVPGLENPADLCSRGCSADTLLSCSLWWSGPDWLWLPQPEWPEELDPIQEPKDDDFINEQKKAHCHVTVDDDGKSEPVFNLDRFSQWSRAAHTMAYIKRWRTRPRPKGELTAIEVRTAQLHIIRLVQKEAFAVEFFALKNRKPLSIKSPLAGLRPYHDGVDDVIRLRRRTEFTREPVENLLVLPHKHRLVTLIVWDTHRRLKHAGVSQTITEIRQSIWILKGRRTVRDLLTRCVECRRLTGPCLRQPTAPLPADRCSSARPFEITGVDFAGPLFIKDNAGVTSKVYICLLTCAAIRGIHLELVSSLSTADFILAFKRFVATRGLCRVVYSDNAKTFKRASELLAQLFENLRTKEVRDYFASSGIEWRFICERSPWWGGFYERLVRSVKTPLKKILGNALLSYDEINTTLKEIEATINSRPLTYVYNNPNDAQPLSPSHFILGDRLTLVPPITTSTTILAEPTKNDLVLGEESTFNSSLTKLPRDPQLRCRSCPIKSSSSKKTTCLDTSGTWAES